MSELPPPDPAMEPSELPPAVPAAVDPARWEDFAGFRETFLLQFTPQEANAALRVVGRLLYDMVLEYNQHWPRHAEGFTRTEVRAAAGDLRHLQGFLADVAAEATASEVDPYHTHLCQVARETSAAIAALADRIERELGPWRG